MSRCSRVHNSLDLGKWYFIHGDCLVETTASTSTLVFFVYIVTLADMVHEFVSLCNPFIDAHLVRCAKEIDQVFNSSVLSLDSIRKGPCDLIIYATLYEVYSRSLRFSRSVAPLKYLHWLPVYISYSLKNLHYYIPGTFV